MPWKRPDGVREFDADAGGAAEPREHRLMSVTMRQILLETAQEFGLEARQMRQRTNRLAIAKPRQVAMYLCRRLTNESLPEIGRFFGGFHHTSVWHAERTVPFRLAVDPKLRAKVEAIEKRLHVTGISPSLRAMMRDAEQIEALSRKLQAVATRFLERLDGTGGSGP